MTPDRIFVGPIEIAGVGTGLVDGFRRLGLQADMRLKAPHPFGYASLELDSHPLVRLWQRLGHWRMSPGIARVPALALLLRFLQWMLSFPVLLIFTLRYDAFIYIFGRTITGLYLELALLRLLGKRCVVVFCGSDARPPYMDGARAIGGVESGGFLPVLALWLHTWLAQHRVRSLEKYAHAVVNSPATAHFHQKPYVNWFQVGIPRSAFPVTAGSEGPPERRSGPVRVIHSPSNPAVKGTPVILDIMKRLADEGLEFELVLLQGASNAQVLEKLRDCDIVCDQLYSDTPMAALASEAAAFGKPALVGGYFAESSSRHIPAGVFPSTLFVLPGQLEDALRRCVGDQVLREELGARAQAYVRTHWDVAVVAGRYLRLLAGDIPDDWWCDPAAVDYVEGCGMPAERSAARIRALVRVFGNRALFLSGRPALQARLLKFAADAGALGR